MNNDRSSDPIPFTENASRDVQIPQFTTITPQRVITIRLQQLYAGSIYRHLFPGEQLEVAFSTITNDIDIPDRREGQQWIRFEFRPFVGESLIIQEVDYYEFSRGTLGAAATRHHDQQQDKQRRASTVPHLPVFARHCRLSHVSPNVSPTRHPSRSVTAPSLAEVTSAAYFASTPRV